MANETMAADTNGRAALLSESSKPKGGFGPETFELGHQNQYGNETRRGRIDHTYLGIHYLAALARGSMHI
jgi:hypothetical protein